MFVSFFGTWPCRMFNSIPISMKLLTNRNIALIYSVIICEHKTKDCARSGSFQHKLQYHGFQTLMFAGFPNQSPLLTTSRINKFVFSVDFSLVYPLGNHVTWLLSYQFLERICRWWVSWIRSEPWIFAVSSVCPNTLCACLITKALFIEVGTSGKLIVLGKN